MNNILLYISLTALLLKVVASIKFKKRWLKSQQAYLITFLLATTFLQSIIELSGYFLLNYANNAFVIVGFKVYYYLLTINLFLFPLIASSLIYNRVNTYWFILSMVAAALFCFCICFTDLIISGVQTYERALTRVPGEYYWVYSATAFLLPLVTLYIMFFSYSQVSRSLIKTRVGPTQLSHYILRNKIINLIIGFAPFVFMLCLVLICMAMGYRITAAGLFSLLLSFFILVICINFGAEKIYDLSIWIPFTKKFKLWTQVLFKVFHSIKYIDSSPKKLPKIIERETILAAVNLYKNQEEAAYHLDMPPSTLSKRLTKYRT